MTVANATDPWGGSYGYYVKIQHDGTFDTLYAYCSSIYVTLGQQVQQGETIGYVGSMGYHLHFEIGIEGKKGWFIKLLQYQKILYYKDVLVINGLVILYIIYFDLL